MVRAGPVFKPEANLIEFGIWWESQNKEQKSVGGRSLAGGKKRRAGVGDFRPSLMRAGSGGSVRAWSGSEPGHARACASCVTVEQAGAEVSVNSSWSLQRRD